MFNLEAFIKRKNKAKSVLRRRRSIRLMKDYPGEYSCTDCIHGQSKSCTDALKNGCEYFYNAKTERKFKAH